MEILLPFPARTTNHNSRSLCRSDSRQVYKTGDVATSPEQNVFPRIGMIEDFSYDEARHIAERIASALESPRFYREKQREGNLSRDLFENHPLIHTAFAILSTYENPYGHGFSHARKVAIDSGTIVINETRHLSDKKLRRMVLLVHIAGVLHDIKRSSPDHAHEGAKEAEIILREFDLTEKERRTISQAIANHEAFKPALPMQTALDQLLSDALYDADKFRWGPDNFTEMIWDIVISRRVPLSKVLEHFMPGMKGIKNIRDTFRSQTGKDYGPNFIDLGLQIGVTLYDELTTAPSKSRV